MNPFGACILSCDGPELTADEHALFRDVRPFGFILFARHIQTPDQVRRLCDALRSAAGHACLITIDQEGGRVQRLRGPQWRDWPAPLDQISAAQNSAERVMYLRARLIAHELFALGIDSNCCPTLDLAGPLTHPFLKNRCYGSEPSQVTTLGRATADGLLAGGVLPVMKHMPGHGRANSDTHSDLPAVSASLEDLDRTDFAPFRALSDLPMSMTAHIVFDRISNTPATLCARSIELIRSKTEFNGLLMTDDISMGALSGSLAGRSQAALAAGCDVVLHCNDTFADRVAVAQAAGPMQQPAQDRAMAALKRRQTPDEIDIPAIEAELSALLDGRVYATD